MGGTVDDLVSSAKRRGVIPTAQATWTTADLLTVANEEMLAYAVPLLNRIREEFYLQQDEYQVSGQAAESAPSFYRLPDRALGGTTRDVVGLGADNVLMDIPRLSLDDLSMASWGYYVLGGLIGFVNRTNFNAPAKIRLTYYLRPSAMQQLYPSGTGQPPSVGIVSSSSLSQRTVTCSLRPASWATTPPTVVDVLRGRPNYETLLWDEPVTYNGTGTFTFTSDSAWPDVEVGDYLCPQEVTPVVQLPPEMHPLLAQRVAVKFLEGQGDSEEMQNAAQVLSRMEKDVVTMLTPRMAGEPRKIVPRDSVWRRWRR